MEYVELKPDTLIERMGGVSYSHNITSRIEQTKLFMMFL